MPVGWITAIVGFLISLISLGLSNSDLLAAHPEWTAAILQSAQPVLLALVSAAVAFLSSKTWWEKFNRILTAVIAYVESTYSGHPNSALRAKAIEEILFAIPNSNLGWRGRILRTPLLGKWIIGLLLDRLASSTTAVMKVPSIKGDLDAASTLKWATEKAAGKFS